MASKLIYGEEDRLLPWAAERIGIIRFRRDAYPIGLERDGALVAVVVFDSFTECDCSMHVASDGSKHWLNKDLLFASFAYPFTQLGFRRVNALIPTKRTDAIRFNKALGFTPEGYHPHMMPDDDCISLGLLKENCRFILKEQEKNG